MAIIRFGDRPYFRHPLSEFERMRRDMDMLMRAVGGEAGMGQGAMVYPLLNVFEDREAVYVKGEIPGVLPGDLEVSVEGDTLLIRGERKACIPEGEVSFHRREIQCGTFSRAVTLPTRVDLDRVEATSVDGILLITLPKAEEVKPRQVEVKVG